MHRRSLIFFALLIALTNTRSSFAEETEVVADTASDTPTSPKRPMRPDIPKTKSTYQQQALKPWHQKVAESVKNKLNTTAKFFNDKVNAASEFVKNKIDDVTKAPRTKDPNWIAKTAIQTHGTPSASDEENLKFVNHNTTRSPMQGFTDALAKAHRLDIQNTNIAYLQLLNEKNLAVILAKITPQQLSDMVSYAGYTFPSNLISKLSSAQAKAMLEKIKAPQSNTAYDYVSANPDIIALENRTKSIFQKIAEKLNRRPEDPSPDISSIPVQKSPAPDPAMQQALDRMSTTTGAKQAGVVVVSSRVPA